MKIYDQHILNCMTQTQCQQWLIEHDSEAADFWRECKPDTDFKECVQENINDYGWQD